MSIIVQLGESESIIDKYKQTGAYCFPAQEKVNPEVKKSKDYCLEVAKAAFSVLVRDKSAIPLDHYSLIQLYRDYLSSSQPTEIYDNIIKAYTNSVSTTTGTELKIPNNVALRKGINNINTKIVSIATNLMNAIHGMYDEYDEDVFVDSIDNESGAEQENAMFEALFDAKTAPIANSIEQMYGIPIGNKNTLPIDTSVEEMEVYKDSGGFKTFWAESMEEVVKYTEKLSKWDRTIKRKFIEDGVAINFICARVKYDRSKMKEVYEYMDPSNFFIQYSNDKNFEDAEYAGYFTLEKIGTLIEIGFSYDDLLKAAKVYRDYPDNPKINDWGHYETIKVLDSRLKEFKIPVFHYYWKEVDVIINKKTTNQYGVTKIDQYPVGTDIEVWKGAEVYPTRLKRAYQCSWVVDTDMVYDYGLIPNQTKKGRESELPVKAWRGVASNDKMVFGSVLESIIPFLDNLQLAWLKYQDALAKFHPGGYKINLRLLQNLSIGGEKIDPLQAYQMFLDTSVLPYMDVAMGEKYAGGDVSPISRIEGAMTEGIAMFKDEIAFISQMIEKITGINPVTLGVTQPNVTATATSIAQSGTNNVLRPIITGVMEVKEGLADLLSRRIPILLRNSKEARDSYSKIIGPQSVDVLVKAEALGAEYGLTMNARPSLESKQRLISMLEAAIQRGRDGESSINVGQAMYILERIESGSNFKKLQRQVDFMIRKADEDAFNKKRQLIQEQSQQQAAQSQAAAQAEMQNKQVDAQLKNAEADKQLERDMMMAKHQQELDIEQEMILKSIESGQYANQLQ